MDYGGVKGDAQKQEISAVEGGRKASLTSINLNKNLDAKYVHLLWSHPKRLLKHCRVSNPLADIPCDVLMREVEDFAREKDIEDLTEMLKKGALVAQDPAHFEQIETLDDAERAALLKESQHKWSHPIALYLTIIVCSIGAAVQGVSPVHARECQTY